MNRPVRIGTRESQLALWQATQVKELLALHRYDAELVPIKSGGDIDLKTPLYEMGVQGIFTKELDIALLENKIDIAVHSLKDVPTQLAYGTQLAAVLKRGPHEDLLVFKDEASAALYHQIEQNPISLHIATSSIRRKAQWLHRFPGHHMHNLRGNVNTRLRKLSEENWHGAIFAMAGLERIGLRPPNSIVLDWMLPAPAQGAIAVVAREDDDDALYVCSLFDDIETHLCTRIEREFLRKLLGGCSTPISAYAHIHRDEVLLTGNILSIDGTAIQSIEEKASVFESSDLGTRAAVRLLQMGGKEIADKIRNEGK